MTARHLALCLLAGLAAACGPATLRYTILVESEPPGAKVYDPRTDEQIGVTPLEVPLEYVKAGPWNYTRRQSRFDEYSAQEPDRKETQVNLDQVDRVRILVAAPGHERADQTLEWRLTPIDGQRIRKRLYLKPITGSLRPEDDVYR
jgi:hypothetical protein